MIKKNNVKKNWKTFAVNVVSPALVTIILFNISIFTAIIPTMKNKIIERKKETIKELTLAVISQLNQIELRVKSGELHLEEAQDLAREQVTSIRYGSYGKDYFWVSDMNAFMIVEPYRSDLAGKDVSKFLDPSGKKLFVEFARIAKENGEGYVDYLWPMMDKTDKIVPKLSYVKLFKPWGWIIGTGIYLEDVREEISHMGKKVAIVTSIISIIIFLLLFVISNHSFKLELIRQKTEAALRKSEEKYRMLVESNNDGVVLTVDDHIAYSNKTFQQMIAYSEDELSKMSIYDIISVKNESEMPGLPMVIPNLVKLKTKDQQILEVICINSSMVFSGRDAIIYTFKNIADPKRPDEALKQLLAELQASLIMPNTQIKAVPMKLVECEIDCVIKRASELMSLSDSSAILVRSPAGNHVGIVTDRDFRQRTILQGVSMTSAISEIMSSPVIKISENALFFEAMNLFIEKKVHHLAVCDQQEKIIGIFTINEVLQKQKHPAAILKKEIEEAKSIIEIKNIRKALISLVRAMLDSGANVESVTKLNSILSDAIINKLVDMGLERLGAAPLGFSFISFGSVAREEQTLKTDQDNGIIYDDPLKGDEEEVHRYFLKLGEFVCENLDDVGYSFCKGEVMAKNPKWCQSMSRWKKYFSDCINAANPQDLLDINVIFDIRSIHGDKKYVLELKELMASLVEDRSVFFYHLAQSTLRYKPPLGFFGNIQLEQKEDKEEAFNIKSAIIPIVNFARIYALKNAIDETSTTARLHQLYLRKVLIKSTYEELLQAYSFLMKMRMVYQADQIDRGYVPDNFIDFNELTHLQQSFLKKILSDILIFQAKVDRDFTRG